MNILLLLVITFFLTSPSVKALETDIGKIHGLAEDIHQVILGSAPLPESYHLTTEEADRAKAYAAYQNEMAEQINQPTLINASESPTEDIGCHQENLTLIIKDKDEIQKKIDKRNLTIGVMISFNTSEDLKNTVNDIIGLKTYSDQIKSSSHKDATTLYNYSSAVKTFLKYRPNIANKWNTYSLEKKVELMRDYIKTKIDLDIDKDLLMVEHSLYESIQTPKNWKSSLLNLSDELSKSQKLNFISSFGGMLNNNYDYAKQGKEGSTDVTQMWEALKNGDPTGICRDVVNAQIQAAIALGFDKDSLYHVTYNALGGIHDYFILVDPDNPSVIHKINYSTYEEEGSRSGETQLKQNGTTPVVGINYVVSDHSGKPAIQLPTELGKMLRDATGYKKKNQEISKTYNIAKIKAKTKYGTGSIFAGETSDGVKVTGLSFSKTDSDFFQYGGALYKTEGETSKVAYSSTNGYLFVDIAPSYVYNKVSESGSKLTIKGEVGYGAEGNFSKTSGTHKETGSELGSDSLLIDIKNHLTPAIEASYTTASGDTSVYARVEAENYFYFDNINESEGITLHNNSVTYKSGVSSKITENLKASLDVAVVTQTLGDYYVVSSGIEDTKRRYTASLMHQAPIGDVVSFAPGATSVTQASFSKDFTAEDGRGGILYIEYTEDELAGGRVGLNGEWVF